MVARTRSSKGGNALHGCDTNPWRNRHQVQRQHDENNPRDGRWERQSRQLLTQWCHDSGRPPWHHQLPAGQLHASPQQNHARPRWPIQAVSLGYFQAPSWNKLLSCWTVCETGSLSLWQVPGSQEGHVKRPLPVQQLMRWRHRSGPASGS